MLAGLLPGLYNFFHCMPVVCYDTQKINYVESLG